MILNIIYTIIDFMTSYWRIDMIYNDDILGKRKSLHVLHRICNTINDF